MNGPSTSSPDSDPVHAGDVLSGKFRVERVLGVGGMGVVVAATHLQLGKLVALKFMLKQALAYPDNVARFEREARAAVRLRSDHVAKVTDVGRLDDDGLAGSGAPYMVMEFLEGEDLDAFLRRNGALPVQQAVDFVLQACEAIAEAHSLGIIHRDLKPKNLFLTERLNGEPLVKVLDFGVSKIVGAPEELSLTATTQVLGSPSYMSPEQLRASRDVDLRTDIWGLGVILYELLTGSLPFPATTLTQLTAMVISDPPKPIALVRQDVPAEVSAIVMRCLEKNPEARFQSVGELAAALAQFASPSSSALATHRVSAGLGTSSSARLSAVPVDRPSFRTPGSNTDVAWDQTQLAPGGRRKLWPIVVGAATLALCTLAAIAIVHSKSTSTGAPERPSATATYEQPSAPVTTTATTTTTVAIEHSAATVTTTTATVPASAPTQTAHANKRDAGVRTTTPTHTGDDLPSTRN
jgi:eukaryotic-like serine/threonine-protein kinase